MSTYLIIALTIPWVFWGVLMGLLIFAGRSWINMMLFPVGMTVIILAIGSLASEQAAMWSSLFVHLLLLIVFVGSYVSFAYKRREKD